MDFKVGYVFIAITLVFFVNNIFGLPRDSGVVKTENVLPINHESLEFIEKKKLKDNEDNITPKYKIPGRVSCEYEDLTEDPVCQEHCIPKGYMHGLCVSKVCSCI